MIASSAGIPNQDARVRHPSGDISTSGDEQLKVRKPYTITKQRERWTEEEHQKFLEALKLYGRAWRRIEEHIGTKTAVQIRSHAQKFFSKLEREQAAGGILAGTAQDIDIPPPRPKRKPSHPYPRKATTSTTESPMASPTALPSTAHGLLVRPTLGERIRATSPVEMGKVLERCKAELKLFGQTVLVPTATRAVIPVLEGKMQNNADGSELQEDISKMKSFSATSDVSMLVSEHDSSNGQSQVGYRNGTIPYCETPSSMHRPGENPQSSLDLAVYYSKFMESLQVAEPVYPFHPGMDANFWQAYSRGVAALWPSFSGAPLSEITASVVRTVMAGAPPEAHMTDSSPSALAAATIAAASAWWALQGSVAPNFHAQRVPPTTENPGQAPVPRNMDVENDELMGDDDDMIGSPRKADKTVHQSFKRQGSGFESVGGIKRVKLRSFGNENEDKARPPSSSGSDDGNEHAGLAEQLNGDADASGNSGPSSHSSRCGADQAAAKSDESSSDKEKTEEEEALTDEVPKTLTESSFQNPSSQHYSSLTHRPRKGLRLARPCRSSGSDGEQRKEVSQEGRIAFQALFSHSKLPQKFSQRVSLAREDYFRRYTTDDSDIDSLKTRRDYGQANNNTNSSSVINNDNIEKLCRAESVASDNPNDECEKKKSALDSSQQQRSRQRSGFVPYRRAVEGESVKAASCRLEEAQLVNISRLVDEEVKASCS